MYIKIHDGDLRTPGCIIEATLRMKGDKTCISLNNALLYEGGGNIRTLVQMLLTHIYEDRKREDSDFALYIMGKYKKPHRYSPEMSTEKEDAEIELKFIANNLTRPDHPLLKKLQTVGLRYVDICTSPYEED